jgi:molybdopterin-guanine dinucleotide biosynthesis protein A
MKMPDRRNIAGAILAGGRSQRMQGRDKALLPLAGKPMIAHAADRLAPQVASVAISANGDLSRFAPLGRPVFADMVEGYLGPLAGILSAMRWTAGENAACTHVVTAAADTPFFPHDLVARMAECAGSGETIVMGRSSGNLHPVFALWPLGLADDLAEWLARGETLKVRAWAIRHDLVACDFPLRADGVDPFFNINTPDDLATAEAILQRAAV